MIGQGQGQGVQPDALCRCASAGTLQLLAHRSLGDEAKEHATK